MSFGIKNISKYKGNSIDILLILSSLVSFIPQISIFSIAIFSINFIFIKRKIKATLVFFNIAVITSLIYYSYLKPKTEEFEKEIFYVGFHSKWEKAAISKLNYYNNKIIEYKSNKGILPDKLDDIQDGYMDFEDISFVTYFEKHKTMKYARFNYEKIDSNHYLLFGLGFDGQPKTDDDLLPEIIISDTSKTDLIRYKIKESFETIEIQSN